MTNTTPSRASLFLWHGCSLIVGPGIDSTPHAHFAAQLTLGLDQPFRARLRADQAWVETQAAIFAPNQSHQLDCGGGMLAHLFVEQPQRQQAVASELLAQYHALPDFGAVRAAIDAARHGELNLDAAEHAARLWAKCALPDASAPQSIDLRIGKAIAWIADHPSMQPGGAQLATMVHLSQSRFTHLFRQQTGLPLSRYLSWTRLLDAVAAVADGANMTTAAHRAGFADLAHMSRSFRGTFGVMPSELQKMTIAFKRKDG
ncbi:MAG: helix-turn-helix domain-containing protein [Noviherbaspirillum sp.]